MLENRPATLLKRDTNTVFSYEYCEIFKNSYFIGHSGGCFCTLYLTFNYKMAGVCKMAKHTLSNITYIYIYIIFFLNKKIIWLHFVITTLRSEESSLLLQVQMKDPLIFLMILIGNSEQNFVKWLPKVNSWISELSLKIPKFVNFFLAKVTSQT